MLVYDRETGLNFFIVGDALWIYTTDNAGNFIGNFHDFFLNYLVISDNVEFSLGGYQGNPVNVFVPEEIRPIVL